MVFKNSRVDYIYLLDFDEVIKCGVNRLVTKNEYSWVWNTHLGNVHFDLINKIASKSLVVDFPKIKFKTGVFFNSKNIVSTLKRTKLLHLDLLTVQGQ